MGRFRPGDRGACSGCHCLILDSIPFEKRRLKRAAFLFSRIGLRALRVDTSIHERDGGSCASLGQGRACLPKVTLGQRNPWVGAEVQELASGWRINRLGPLRLPSTSFYSESLSENSEGSCGEGIWRWPRRRGRSIPEEGCNGRVNAGHRQKTRRPKGFLRNSPLSSLLVGHRPIRVCSLLAPRHRAVSEKTGPL